MESLRRKTIQVNLVRIPPQLKEHTSRIPENFLFSERHGRLLSLVNTNIEEEYSVEDFVFSGSTYA